ncbi:MAG TPA: hypothetical protein H9946_05370 [Candidatus Jeotgalibaca pullicola]|nr:hypothetical protein [Candidatus Jeotgalibaca pullicola]
MQKDYGLFYKKIRGTLRFFSPEFSIKDSRIKKEGPVVYVAHHQNMFGPISVLCWHPEFLRIWVLHVFLDFSSCYHHYLEFTFTKRLGWPHLVSKIIAYPTALFVAALTKSGKGIPVYRQSRSIVVTMKQTVDALENGESILLFPDISYDDPSAQVKEIYEGFLYIEKYYYRKTGEHIPFVPMIAEKKEKEIRIGTPILFSGKEAFFLEKQKIAKEIQQKLNELAKGLE